MQTEQTPRKQPYEFHKSTNSIFKSISTYMFWVSIYLFIGGIIYVFYIWKSREKWLYAIFYVVQVITYILVGWYTLKTSKSFNQIVQDQNDIRNLKFALRQMKKLYQIERWIVQINICFLVLIPVLFSVWRLVQVIRNR